MSSEGVEHGVPPSVCAAHGRPTKIYCVECGKPICPDCLVQGPVGFACDQHPQDVIRDVGPTRPRPAPMNWRPNPLIWLWLTLLVPLRFAVPAVVPLLRAEPWIAVILAVIVFGVIGYLVWRRRLL